TERKHRKDEGLPAAASAGAALLRDESAGSDGAARGAGARANGGRRMRRIKITIKIKIKIKTRTGGGVARGGLEPYRRTKADKHWVFLRWHPYRPPYRAVPGVPIRPWRGPARMPPRQIGRAPAGPRTQTGRPLPCAPGGFGSF